jgi:hypothetical protein
MEKRCCVACGGQLEAGAIRARSASAVPEMGELGLVMSAFAFVRPGTPTSANPLRAFLQGLRDEPGEQELALAAFRCVGCGRVELYANNQQQG